MVRNVIENLAKLSVKYTCQRRKVQFVIKLTACKDLINAICIVGLLPFYKKVHRQLKIDCKGYCFYSTANSSICERIYDLQFALFS